MLVERNNLIIRLGAGVNLKPDAIKYARNSAANAVARPTSSDSVLNYILRGMSHDI